MLIAYLDESGTHRGSRITAVAGFVGTVETWRSLETKWSAALNDFPGITAFHAHDCEERTSEFSSLNRELRYALMNRLARIIGEHPLFGLSSAVINRDWHSMTFDSAFAGAFPKPFYLCFAEVARALADWSAQRGGAEVALIYAEQPEFKDKANEIWDAYSRNKTAAGLRSFTTISARHCIPLQAADLYAFEANRSWTEREYGDEPPLGFYRVRKSYMPFRDGAGPRHAVAHDEISLQFAMRRFRETGEI